MSSLLHLHRKESIFVPEDLNLYIEHKAHETHIDFRHSLPIRNTQEIAEIFDFFKSNFPDIYLSECFNEGNFSFSEEIRNTELGHLFEHILLVKLVQLKVGKGFDNVRFIGRTYWKGEASQEAKIIFSAGYKDRAFFMQAFSESLEIFKKALRLYTKQAAVVN
jgi:hypothetical protein